MKLQRGGHGLEFTAADITAAPIFADPAQTVPAA
jgi:hypothetical protein